MGCHMRHATPNTPTTTPPTHATHLSAERCGTTVGFHPPPADPGISLSAKVTCRASGAVRVRPCGDGGVGGGGGGGGGGGRDALEGRGARCGSTPPIAVARRRLFSPFLGLAAPGGYWCLGGFFATEVDLWRAASQVLSAGRHAEGRIHAAQEITTMHMQPYTPLPCQREPSRDG